MLPTGRSIYFVSLDQSHPNHAILPTFVCDAILGCLCQVQIVVSALPLYPANLAPSHAVMGHT